MSLPIGFVSYWDAVNSIDSCGVPDPKRVLEFREQGFDVGDRRRESMHFGADPILELRQKDRHWRTRPVRSPYYLQLEDPKIVSCYADHFRPVRGLDSFVCAPGEQPKPTVAPIRQDRRQGRVGLRKRRVFISLISEELNFAIWGDKPVDFTHVFHSHCISRRCRGSGLQDAEPAAYGRRNRSRQAAGRS